MTDILQSSMLVILAALGVYTGHQIRELFLRIRRLERVMSVPLSYFESGEKIRREASDSARNKNRFDY